MLLKPQPSKISRASTSYALQVRAAASVKLRHHNRKIYPVRQIGANGIWTTFPDILWISGGVGYAREIVNSGARSKLRSHIFLVQTQWKWCWLWIQAAPLLSCQTPCCWDVCSCMWYFICRQSRTQSQSREQWRTKDETFSNKFFQGKISHQRNLLLFLE